MKEVLDREKILDKLRDSDTINVSKPEVEIVRMKLESINKLADDNLDIFSELSGREIELISKARVFAKNPIPNANNRLKQFQINIVLPILDQYITEFLKQRFKKNRKRVDEFIKALDSIGSQKIMSEDQSRIDRFRNRLL